MRKNNNWNNQKKHWNSKYNKKKKDEHYLDKFKGATVEVRNGDVNDEFIVKANATPEQKAKNRRIKVIFATR